MEYPELEGTHENHRVQRLALHRTAQWSHPVPQSVVQTLLELPGRGEETLL